MASNGGKRSSAPGNNSSLILGILIGMVLGLAVAGAVAWHLSKRPSAFVTKEQPEATTAVPSSAPRATIKTPVAVAAPPAAPAASAVSDGKPRFEFYKILTDKEGTTPKNTGHSGTTAAAPKSAPKTAAAPLLLQAGSFASGDEADKLKAKLALLGMEAAVQTANVPGKGTYYRVRLGPYRTADELNKANSTLKQNGITDAAPVRGQ